MSHFAMTGTDYGAILDRLNEHAEIVDEEALLADTVDQSPQFFWGLSLMTSLELRPMGVVAILPPAPDLTPSLRAL